MLSFGHLIISVCSMLAGVRETKVCMDVDGEHCLLLLHDPPSLQADGSNTICHTKSGSVKMRGWCGLVDFFLHQIRCGAIKHCTWFAEASERYRGWMDRNVKGSLLYSHPLPHFGSTLSHR